MTNSLDFGDISSPAAFNADVQAERKKPSEAHTVTHPGECPWRGVKLHTCDICRNCGGSIRYWSLQPLVLRVYDTTRCLRIVGQETRAVALEQARALIRQAGLTPEESTHTFRNAVYDEYNKQPYQKIQVWQPNSGRGLLILPTQENPENASGNGVGKSYALHALCIKLACVGIESLYRTSAQFLQELQRSFDVEKWENSEAEVMAQYMQTPVLLLDNLGGEALKDTSTWAPNRLFSLIDERLRFGRPIVAAGRFGLDRIAAHFGPEHGPDIASRLAGHCDAVQLGGPDRRVKSDV